MAWTSFWVEYLMRARSESKEGESTDGLRSFRRMVRTVDLTVWVALEVLKIIYARRTQAQ